MWRRGWLRVIRENKKMQYETQKSSAEPPKHSIIIPVYNGEPYLRECIESALAQTFRDLEIIITDNCSTDATAEIAISFKDTRIRYFRQDTNIGMVRNWNFGVSKVRAGTFQILCADDFLEPQFLQRSIGSTDSRTMTFSNCTVLANGSRCTYDNPYKTKKNITKFDLLLKMHGVPLSSVIFNRSPKIGDFDTELNFNCDLEYIYRSMCLAKFDIRFINEPLVNVRLHDANETLKYNHRIETVLALKKMMRYTRSPACLLFMVAKLIKSS